MRALIAAAILCAVSAPASAGDVASFYGSAHHGRKTASGERFNMHAMTAAHRSLSFETRVLVTYRGRSVIVRINDRGPFIRGRTIDLSQAAARAIGLPGVGAVSLHVLRKGDWGL